MNIRFSLVLISFLLLLMLVGAEGAVEVSGPVTSDTSWTNTDTVRVTGDVVVIGTARLTIQPGTIVMFNSSTGLYIDGRLTADGGDGSEILFTSHRDTTDGSPAPGDWQGIVLRDSSDYALCLLDYCEIRYPVTGISLDENRLFFPVQISNCSIVSCSNIGINAQNSSPAVESCTISDFQNHGIYISGSESDIALKYTNILQEWLYLGSGRGIEIGDDASLTLVADSISGVDRGIHSSGSSTELDSCRISDFISYGLYFTGSSSLVIDNSAIIQIAPGLGGTGLYCGNSIDISISGSRLAHCDYGIDLYSTTTSSSNVPVLTLTNCYVDSNETYGLYVHASSTDRYTPRVTANYNNIYDNGVNHVRAYRCTDNGTELDFRFNWWGTADGYTLLEKVYDRLDYSLSPIVNCSGPLDAPYPGGSIQNGYINGIFDTTLPAADSPYRVIGYFEVPSDGVLIIEAGSSVYVTPGIYLYVYGEMIADGVEANRISFTSSSDTVDGSPSASDWEGIYFNSNSTGLLDNCDIEYANKGVYVSNTSVDVTVDSSDISHCDQGIEVYTSTTNSSIVPELILTYSSVDSNDTYGVHVRTNSGDRYIPHVTANYNNIYDNGTYDVRGYMCTDYWTELDSRYNWWGSSDGFVLIDRIYDRLDHGSSPIVNVSGLLDDPYPGGVPQNGYINGSFDTTLTITDSPYRVIGYSGVPSGALLSVEAGCEFHFMSSPVFYVFGELIAGTSDEAPVLFTSASDSLNGSPSPGDWKGINFMADSYGFLENCEIRYADNGIYFDNNLTATISGCLIRECNSGIHAYRDPTVYLIGCELRENDNHDIHLKSNSAEHFLGLIRNCNIYNNGSANSWGIYCSRNGSGAGGATIDAEYNWWRYPDSAVIEDDFVYDHEDDGNLPRVDFMPFVGDENLRPCPSDFDFSGRTDYDDLAMLGFAFGSEPDDFNWLPVCNISEIGFSELRIDGLDLAFFGSQFGIEGGCYPFGKVIVPRIVADSFSLIVSRTLENDSLIVRLKPILPSGHNLLGIAFDLTVGSSLLIQEPFEYTDGGIQRSEVSVLKSVKNSEWICAVASMTRGSVEGASLDELLRLKLGCSSAALDSVVTLRNVAFIVDGYHIVLSPRVTYEQSESGLLPEQFAVYQNYPNPFNPSTTISYALDTTSDVSVTIFNTLGQTVRSFTYPQQAPGVYEVVWDGKDSYGNEAATGIYFYRVESNSRSNTKKMLLLK
jgi:hypothetical protein